MKTGGMKRQMSEEIRIKGLRLVARIGVPEEERATPQELRADVRIWPRGGFPTDDEIGGTINYAEVCGRLRKLAGAGERRLLETLAGELCEEVLGNFPAGRVRVGLRKFILAETDWVGVALEREAVANE